MGSPVAVIDTDFVLARQVGAALGRGRLICRGGCAGRGGGLMITSDPDDIARLAAAVPAARVTTRRPR